MLETLTYPIEELPFPTVTVCPRDSNPDRWGPTIKLFDFVKMDQIGSDELMFVTQKLLSFKFDLKPGNYYVLNI